MFIKVEEGNYINSDYLVSFHLKEFTIGSQSIFKVLACTLKGETIILKETSNKLEAQHYYNNFIIDANKKKA